MYKRGFTLIELLVVIAIIGILVSIIIPNLSGAKQAANDARRVSDLRSVQLALAEYYNDQPSAKYPLSIYANYPAGLKGQYLSKVPTDPVTNANYLYSAYGTGASCSGSNPPPSSYHLGAKMDVPGSSFLSQDADYSTGATACIGSDPNFNGAATDCSGVGVGTPENCYDVVQN